MKKDQAKILAKAAYNAICQEAEGPERSQRVKNFLVYLSEHHLNSLIPKILEELENIYLAEKGIIKTTVSSKENLSEKEVKQIADFVSQRSGKKVEIKEELDQDLIGGAVIKYQDRLIDLSIKKQLNNLAKQLAS